MRTAIINGREMNADEIAHWIALNRNYTLHRRTILTRMRKGFTGEELVGPPIPQSERRPHYWPQELVPVAVPGWGFRS